jgi:hypothetical protein
MNNWMLHGFMVSSYLIPPPHFLVVTAFDPNKQQQNEDACYLSEPV